jgi:hypothetical protein
MEILFVFYLAFQLGFFVALIFVGKGWITVTKNKKDVISDNCSAQDRLHTS